MLTKKNFLPALIAGVLAAVVFMLPSCTKKDAAVNGVTGPTDAIKSAGVLKVGVKSDVPGFGVEDTSGQYSGLEIDLARLFATAILGDETKVKFTPVTAKTRGPLIDNGDVDMIIATFTITEERKLSYNFSTPYYTDAVGMLVLKSSGISSLKDCDGKIIGVAQSATSKGAIAAKAEELGIKVKFQEYANYPEIKAALDSGRINVFSVDKSILNGYLDAASQILPDTFAPQPYGVVTKLSNKALADYVESKINEWLSDGTITDLVEKYKL
ncbi:MAG: transporter substrate-binding domain-containing protein [Spirochaetaceae bacterium]|jgi:putative glutamine transport system substrate-binding protein|nr:transporter substrate-binding domain-containing protein [Spirochaetaceae bacterium]